ncbi:aminotransferase class V-fold PLP-dependent enzyme [Phytohabitans sp. ZYX-F-186]|uniref:Aminotransferase class V-fold PLP-dependent enzyme n=1 Tax=Phytohabitans maris TaxID=3071409 RepID=A0ABU0ZTQ8_9ACTN|nr:aminotransferase class V-fold PLP-dependent enzyme [Phytohabitans sp. ZYX-F-186]MDQ7910428.1 aminotransferase class V-fold PLP-dependent enzyme [Phytohabitans sp. ZYX-F-186]
MTLDIVGADLPVRLRSGATVRFAHLDYAASAPCARVAAEAVERLLPWYGSVHRGAGVRSGRSTLEYERARQAVGDFAGARAGDAVVFTRNTTDALNLLARALPPGTTTVVFDGEHHANLLPWPDPVRLPAPPDPDAAADLLDRALAGIAGPAVLAVTGASNVTGELWPVRRLADVARGYGARVVVDAAQLAPHRPVDMDALGADYLAFSGHKLYAPFGAGVLVGRADWLDAAEPYLRGGGASAAVGDRAGDVTWATGPARHEGGTPNLLGAASLAAVCEAIADADREALHAHERELLERLLAGLAAVPAAVPVSLFDPGHPRVGIVSVALPGHDVAAVAERLGADHGVGVRAGQFCAHPFTRRLAGVAAAPGGDCGTGPAALLRISFGLGSTGEDIDRAVAALAAETGGRRHDAA